MHAYYHPNTWALLGLGESVSCHLCAMLKGGPTMVGFFSYNVLMQLSIYFYYQYPTIVNSKNEDTNDC